MEPIKTFEQANSTLQGFLQPNSKQGKYNLDRMRSLMSYLGDPQNKYQVVHVAGTSGKTSTCYYISRLLNQAKIKTGLSVSPHVGAINERVQIDGLPLDEDKFFGYLNTFLKLINKSSLTPMYFEVLIAFAYWVFEKEEVDVAVVEVGIGGLLDCTNVITNDNKICVITDIGYDHTDLLGNTLAEISVQKAGIILANNHVFINDQPSEVIKTVEKVVAERFAKLQIVKPKIRIEGVATFQQRNFDLAYAAARYTAINLKATICEDKDVLSRIEKASIPGRLESFETKGKSVILDGSHNPQKIHSLVEGIKEIYPKPSTLLVSFGNNKIDQIVESLNELHELSDSIVITKFDIGSKVNRLPIDPDLINNECKNQKFKNIKIITDPKEAFEYCLNLPEKLIVVTGSFFLLNHLRPIVLDEQFKGAEKH